MPFRPRWYFFVALVSITFIGPLSIHLIIPAMPAVKEAFGVSTGMAQLTLSVEMLSMACFTVAYGGLSDRFGRKRVLLSGLVLFTFGAASCVAATNLPMLLAGRILQGAGAGCGVVLARAIARKPLLLLADEPTGSLDETMAGEVLDVIKDIWTGGTTVLFATHQHSLAVALRQRTLVLQGGRVVKDEG